MNSLKTTTLFYKKLNVDPTVKHSEIVNSTIESFKKEELISNSTASKLSLDKVRTPQFHISPEAHKPSVPGRLVVSSIECHESNMPNHCSYIKATSHKPQATATSHSHSYSYSHSHSHSHKPHATSHKPQPQPQATCHVHT